MTGLPNDLWSVFLGLYVAATVVQCAAYGKMAALWWGERYRTDVCPVLQPVSVVICARNEATNLRQNLPAVLAQEFAADWELIVVDDASEDESAEVLQRFEAENPGRLRVIRLFEKKSPGKKHALAQGIAAAKHDILLLTDADCQPASPQWLRRMATALLTKPETDIVLGYGPMSRFTPDFLRFEAAWVASQYFSFALAGMPYMGVGRNLAFKKRVFGQIGGFSAHAHVVSGDDDLLVNAVATAFNTTICVAPEAFVYSAGPSGFSAWIRQKRRHLSASPMYRRLHRTMLTVLAASQVGHWLLFGLLLGFGFWPKTVLFLFFLRLFSVWAAHWKVFGMLREQDLMVKIPLFDLWMAGYYLAVPWLLWKKGPLEWR